MNWAKLNDQLDQILKLIFGLAIIVGCLYIFVPGKSKITTECMTSPQTEKIAQYIKATQYPTYDLHTIKISHCLSQAK